MCIIFRTCQTLIANQARPFTPNVNMDLPGTTLGKHLVIIGIRDKLITSKCGNVIFIHQDKNPAHPKTENININI